MPTAFQVTKETIERHDLDASDLNRWGLVVAGTINLFDTLYQAVEASSVIDAPSTSTKPTPSAGGFLAAPIGSHNV